MAYVPIPKDLKRVKTKVAFNLTKRQLIGFTIAGAVGFPTYLAVKNVLPNDLSILVMIAVTLPIFFITMFEKDGLNFERYFKYVYLQKFYQPKKRVRKEVYLEEQKASYARAKARKKKKLSSKKKKRS